MCKDLALKSITGIQDKKVGKSVLCPIAPIKIITVIIIIMHYIFNALYI